MNYTPKPSSRITPSIGENRMKIRTVDFECSAFRQTDRQTDVAEGLRFIYIDCLLYILQFYTEHKIRRM